MIKFTLCGLCDNKLIPIFVNGSGQIESASGNGQSNEVASAEYTALLCGLNGNEVIPCVVNSEGRLIT